MKYTVNSAAVCSIHQIKVLHRYTMPVQNIIRNDMHAWISNFGLLAFFESKWKKTPNSVKVLGWNLTQPPDIAFQHIRHLQVAVGNSWGPSSLRT